MPRPLIRIGLVEQKNGVILSDGIESDYLQFNSGTEATVTAAERQGYLVT